MTHLPPPAEELRLLDAELWQLDARRAQLLARRAWLLAALHRPPPTPPPTRPETSAPRVQNVLLVLGGVLLALAAMAFTLVGWGRLGIAGRSVVLGAVTLAVLAAPVPLLRRGLGATAEAVAGLGLALTVLDAYALYEVAWSGADGTGYAAVAAAVLASVWAGYGWALGALPGRPALRLPLPGALAVAQLPLLLGAVALDAGLTAVASVLVVSAAADTLVASRWGAGPVRVVALVGAYGMGGWAALVGGLLWVGAAGPGAAVRVTVLLALLAALVLAVARRLARPEHAVAHAVVGGLLLVAALGALPRVLLPAGWTVPLHLACAVGLLGAVRTQLPLPMRRGLAGASATVQALALVSVAPVVAVALVGPVAWVGRVWSGAPSDARAAVTGGGFWPAHSWTAPVVLVAVAAVLASAVRDPDWRGRARDGALGLVWAAVLTLPALLELPYPAALLVQFLTVTALLPASRARLLPLVLALVTSVPLALSALATRTATLVVLAALVLLCAGGARFAGRAAFLAPAALGYAAAFAVAVGGAAGWAPAHTALLVLVVATAAALLAARLGNGSEVTVPVEAAGVAAGLLAVGLAATDPALLALVLGLCGAVTAATAARGDRRPAGYPATGLFVLAAWVRLAAWEVTAPEAYTLPVSVAALLAGAVRRRRDTRVTSWTAYGAGLAVTLLPSLAATWSDVHGTRPLLLGAAALVLTLLGARHRLRAPLVLGGAVLVLVALHELAPYLVQLAGAVLRWVPPALAGAVLLGVGATYERRLRDVRRVREALGRMG
ncbi:SCO7613 C-terminal domain-containing membrane protein [Streptomyces sp. NPDC087294]|uniref:SCO7613 C-terminal domain-containing membrane protein n=1 Tax=Streptomyces sp. NPDC087294 TaxID=3365777 RepID=UPI0038131A53